MRICTAHIPKLVKCMSDPTFVPLCIKSLSNTTFVAEVTAPPLSVLVPLLTRALNDRSKEVQRRAVVVIDNLVKLVRDPVVAATHLGPLVIGVNKIAEGAAFPGSSFYLGWLWLMATNLDHRPVLSQKAH